MCDVIDFPFVPISVDKRKITTEGKIVTFLNNE